MPGLSFLLYAAQKPDFGAFWSSRGVRFFIHNQSYTPSIFDGFDVSVETETNIAVSRVISKRLPKPYPSGCIDDITSFGSVFTDFYARNNMTYSQKDCFDYCYNRAVTQKCGCYDTTFAKMTFGMPPCTTYGQFQCRLNLFQNFYTTDDSYSCFDECNFSFIIFRMYIISIIGIISKIVKVQKIAQL